MFPFAFTPGPLEIIIVLVIVLLLFGAKRLPELGRSLGTGMREFKSSVTGKDRDDDENGQLEAPQQRDASTASDGGSATEAPAQAQSEPAPAERAETTRS